MNRSTKNYCMHRITHDNAPLQLKSIVDAAWHIVHEKLQSLQSDSTFEKAVKYYLERLGATDVFIPAKTCLSKAPGDADVIAVFEALRVKNHRSGEALSRAC